MGWTPWWRRGGASAPPPGSSSHWPGASSVNQGRTYSQTVTVTITSHIRILVLDEATSCLDSVREHKVQKLLLELLHQSTIINVAHRLANILEYDR